MIQCKRCHGYFDGLIDSKGKEPEYCENCQLVLDIVNVPFDSIAIEPKDDKSSILTIDLNEADEVVFDRGKDNIFSIEITLDQNDPKGKEIYDLLEAWFEATRDVDNEEEENKQNNKEC